MNLKRAIKDVNIRIVAGSFLLLYITQATKIHWSDELYWLMSAFFITLAVSALTTLLLERSLTHRALEDPERQSSRLKQFMSMEDGGFQYFAPKFETFDEEILSKVADRVTTRFCYIVISGRRFHETHLDLLKQLITNK